ELLTIDRAVTGDQVNDRLPGLCGRAHRDRRYVAPDFHAASSAALAFAASLRVSSTCSALSLLRSRAVPTDAAAAEIIDLRRRRPSSSSEAATKLPMLRLSSATRGHAVAS